MIDVQTIEGKDVEKYGVVNPVNANEKDNKLFEINKAVEKPSFENAPSNKAILGRYIFTPELMPILRNLKPGKGNEVNVVDAFSELIKQGQKIYAYEFKGTRYDLGSIDDFVKGQIDYALESDKIKDSIKKHIQKVV